MEEPFSFAPDINYNIYIFFSAICHPECVNDGVCIAPGVCQCPRGFHGEVCQEGEKFKQLLKQLCIFKLSFLLRWLDTFICIKK